VIDHKSDEHTDDTCARERRTHRPCSGAHAASSTTWCSERANSTHVLFLASSSQHTCRHTNRTRNNGAAAPPCLLCVHSALLAHPLPACSQRRHTLRCASDHQTR
jgi:hypothetical protein